MTDSTRWSVLCGELRRAREAAGLTLADINVLSPGHLSRIERNLATPTAAVVEAYAAATGAQGLIAMYMQNARPKSGEPGTQETGEYTLSHAMVDELATTIRIAANTHVDERRTIRARVEPLGTLRIQQAIFQEAEKPQLLDLNAVKARIDSTTWVARRYLFINLEFPRDLMIGESHQFSLLYEFDFIYPRYTFTPLVQARKFSLTIQFPHSNYTAFDCAGLPPTVADDFAEAALRHESHGMPPLGLDRFNCVERTYENITTGYAYGIIWREE
ncbi:MAG: helix-turn-helix domain-containing protein [Aeromicrobium sp.]